MTSRTALFLQMYPCLQTTFSHVAFFSVCKIIAKGRIRAELLVASWGTPAAVHPQGSMTLAPVLNCLSYEKPSSKRDPIALTTLHLLGRTTCIAVKTCKGCQNRGRMSVGVSKLKMFDGGSLQHVCDV